jgi:hypothetical protein
MTDADKLANERAVKALEDDRQQKAYEKATYAVRRLCDDLFIPFVFSEVEDFLYNHDEEERDKAIVQIARWLKDYATVIPKKVESTVD